MKNRLLIPLFSLLSLAAAAQCSNCLIPFLGASQGLGTSSAVTIPIPAAVQPGDFMIAAIHSGWCLGGSVLAPAGWTLIANTANNGSGCGSNATPQLTTFYKFAGATEPSSYVFSGSTSQEFVGGIVAYSGVDSLNPINASSSNGSQDSCAHIVASGVTTTTCTRLVNVFFCSVNFSGNNIVPPTSLTERVDVGNSGNHPWGNENLEISDELMTTVGATGSRYAALANCNSDGWITGGQMIALTCNLSLSTTEPLLAENLQLMPNPSTGIFDLVVPAVNQLNYRITDALGQNVQSGKITLNKTTIDLSAQSKGLYFLQLISGNSMVTRKLIIE